MSPLPRREFLALAGAATGGAYLVSLGAASRAAADTTGYTPKYQFRAMWISSVENIDWPSSTGLTVEQQRAEYISWLDLAKRINLNAVITQIRPTADAFWPSTYEPWSQYLTGTQGVDPGYDPLAFQIEQAHKRNLEYHAWFNPYRVSMQTDLSKLSPDHPARLHPDWVFAYGPKLYYNPGIPEVRRFVEDAMLDAVKRYDIDAVHFDDYFYPYPIGTTPYPDAETYARYGAGFDSIEDWRRDNINKLVQEMQQRVHELKPWLKFGISPFGIWKNASSDPLGSQTNGTQSYDAISADTRTWVKQGWVDYINPQIYWQIGLAVADYAKLVPWWSDVVSGTDVSLYIGQATYKETSGVFTDPAELSNHLTFNHDYPQVDGDVWFSAKDVRADARGSTSLMVQTHYSRPAIVPPISHLGGEAPAKPLLAGVSTSPAGRGVTIIDKNINTNIDKHVDKKVGKHLPGATSFAIWRFDGAVSPTTADLADASHLLATIRATDSRVHTYLDNSATPGVTYTYVVTGYDRLWNESAPSRAVASRS